MVLFGVSGCQRRRLYAQLFFPGCDSTIRIIGRKTQAAGSRRGGEREALAFISFAIDHAYDKITQPRENGI